MRSSRKRIRMKHLCLGAKSFLKRAFCSYLIVGLVIVLFVDYKKLLLHASIQTLNRLQPTYRDVLEFAKKEGCVGLDKLELFEMYYKHMVRKMPQHEALLAMLSLCYYQHGEEEQAITYLKKAIQQNPYFFAYHFNLGVIYYNRGQYAAASKFFFYASRTSPQAIIKLVETSKTYQSLMKGIVANSDELIRRIRENYGRSYLLYLLSQKKLENTNEVYQFARHLISSAQDRRGIIYFMAGSAAYELEKYHEAVFFLKKALGGGFNFKEAKEWLVVSLEKLGEDKMAQRILRAFPSLPSFEESDIFTGRESLIIF